MTSPSAYSLRPRIRVTRGDVVIIGPGKADLLEAIAQTGSIRSAAEAMSMSYMRAWSLIRTMNASFREPLVEKTRGGAMKGGATLTPTGEKVLRIYHEMDETSLKAAGPGWKKLRALLK